MDLTNNLVNYSKNSSDLAKSGLAKNSISFMNLKTVSDTIQALSEDIDKHRSIIASILQTDAHFDHKRGESIFKSPNLKESSRELKLKIAIKDAIDVLDESRKSFKSKRLEALRRQLTQALVETE